MATFSGPSASPTDKAIKRIAEAIASPDCRSVVFLTGAGMSCGAGIPDFRSPGGMYDTLRPERITATEQQRALMRTDPTYVVERGMFMANPFPYLEVRRPFILGTAEGEWRATLAHRFLEILHRRTGKLTRVFTQNIDGLDFQCQIPRELVTPVHGSLGAVACEGCGAAADVADFCAAVRANIKDIYDVDPTAPEASTPVRCPACGQATLKPSTVLFGSPLPAEFFERKAAELGSADLVVIAGTSLVVGPANTVAFDAPPQALRAVINRERVGEDLGLRYDGVRAVLAQGDCDAVFLALIDALGWRDDIEALAPELPASGQELLRATAKNPKGSAPLPTPAASGLVGDNDEATPRL